MERILLHAFAALLYLCLGVYFWRTRVHRPADNDPAQRWERAALLVALGFHGFLLYRELFVTHPLRFGFGQALSVTLWLAVLVYWFESLFIRLQGMQALVLPIAALCAFVPGVYPGLVTPDYAQGVQFRAHLFVAMAAYSLFTLAALHALLMTLLENRLHRRPAHPAVDTNDDALHGPFAYLPPLLTLEALLFRMLWGGFALLTLTLVSGFFFSEALFNRPLQFNHKTVFAILSWLIFAALLIGRQVAGWRGRRALRWTLAGFATLLLAYVGSRFVLEALLGRT